MTECLDDYRMVATDTSHHDGKLLPETGNFIISAANRTDTHIKVLRYLLIAALFDLLASEKDADY